MPTVWLICPDAALREQLLRNLRDGEELTVCVKPCAAEAVVAVPPVLTQAQVEALQAYVDTGGVREAARCRCCSVETIRCHLAAARARVGAKNVAQLVHIAWMLGLLTAPSSTNWLQKWQKLAIDMGGGQSRIGVENNLSARRVLTVSRKPSRRLPVVLACLGAGWIILVALAEYALPGDRVWVVGERYDAGQVSAGMQIRHRVWLINPSLRRLQVEVQPTCGCTAVGLRDGVLPPLGIRQVQLQVDTEGRMPGTQQEAVDIILRTGDASWRERLTVRFTVVGHQGHRGKS